MDLKAFLTKTFHFHKAVASISQIKTFATRLMIKFLIARVNHSS